MKPFAQEFAIYKGDELLCIGTAKECAKELGVSIQYIYWLVTPASRKRLEKRKNPDRCIVAERV